MSPIAKFNFGAWLCLICLILLPNAAGLGGALLLQPDPTSGCWTSSQLTV